MIVKRVQPLRERAKQTDQNQKFTVALWTQESGDTGGAVWWSNTQHFTPNTKRKRKTTRVYNQVFNIEFVLFVVCAFREKRVSDRCIAREKNTDTPTGCLV